MPKKPIFIHSLFRTGSTYVWNKFRQDDRYSCYYEPFNQFLSEISTERAYIWAYDSKATDEVRHPRITKNHLFEYKKLIKPGQKGIPFFKKSFSFDDYCKNDSNPGMKRYIDNLIHTAEAEGKTPVLQFNRSAFKIKWFKRYFPGSINIYLARNSHDQWHSYISMLEENSLDIFLIMDVLTAGINRNNQYFKRLGSYVHLVEFHSEKFYNEELIYRALLDVYSYDELYHIFYFIWLTALWESACHSDILIAIDLVSSDKLYNKKIIELLNKNNIEGIDFSDAKSSHYTEYKLESKKMEEIEGMVKSSIFQNHTIEERNYFLSKLSRKEKKIFYCNQRSFSRKKSSTFKIKDKDEVIIKLEHILKKFFDLYILKNSELEKIVIENDRKSKLISQRDEHIKRLTNKISTVQKDLTQTKQDLHKAKQNLDKVKNSYSYKVGKFVLFPLRMIKKFLEKK